MPQAPHCGCWCMSLPSAMNASWWFCSCSPFATSQRSSSPSTLTTPREVSANSELICVDRTLETLSEFNNGRRIFEGVCSVCLRRSVQVRQAGALGDALALGTGVGAARAQGAAAAEPPGACQYYRTPCKHARSSTLSVCSLCHSR